MTTEHLTVHHFFQACLTERSAEHTLALTDPSISVMGTSTDTAILDRKEFRKMLENEFAIHPEPVTFRIHNWNQQPLVPGLWNCFFIIDMAYNKENIPAVISSLPVSITLRQQGKDYRICSLHISIFAANRSSVHLLQGISALESFPQKDIMNLLCQFIPGGMIGVYLEDGYPLYMVNDTLLSWLEYTYEQFISYTEGFMERIIHAADRSKVFNAITDQLSQDSSYELEYRLIRKDGSCLWVNDIGRKVTLTNGKSILINILIDTSRNARDRSILMERSVRDPLTGLYNRRGGQHLISRYLDEFSAQTYSYPYLFLILDIDNFKALNDIYGHREGDRMLQFLAKLLQTTFRASDVIFRLGGDEFIIFLPQCPDIDPIHEKITRFCREYRAHARTEYPDSDSTLSLGGIQSRRRLSFECLYQAADKILYKEKSSGKNTFHILYV